MPVCVRACPCPSAATACYYLPACLSAHRPELMFAQLVPACCCCCCLRREAVGGFRVYRLLPAAAAAAASGVKLIVGVEADTMDIEDWAKSWGRQLQIAQWTIAASPWHPVLIMAVHR